MKLSNNISPPPVDVQESHIQYCLALYINIIQHLKSTIVLELYREWECEKYLQLELTLKQMKMMIE